MTEGFMQRVQTQATLLIALLCSAVTQGEEGRLILRPEGKTESAPHGQGNIYAPSVWVDEDRWHLWYGGQGKDGHDRIHYAWSRDGKSWTKQGVVLDVGTALHVNDPSVVRFHGDWWMFFTDARGELRDTIHAATSEDGIHWDRKGEVLGPGKPSDWDGLHVARPSVLVEGDQLILWYDGRRDVPTGNPLPGLPTSDHSVRAVGRAKSNDGVHWEKDPEPVFHENAGGIDVVRGKDQYVMVIESSEGTRVTQSTDGVQWKASRLLIPKEGASEAFGHVTPHLVSSGNAWMLFFGAASAPTWDHNAIGRAEISADTLFSRVPGAAEP